MSAAKPRIGITLGDCAGIGPEIVDLALKSGRVPDSAEYVVIGRQPNCYPGKPTIETARRGIRKGWARRNRNHYAGCCRIKLVTRHWPPLTRFYRPPLSGHRFPSHD